MKRKQFEISLESRNNHTKKKNLPIFDELDKLVNSFSMVNRKNQNIFRNNLSTHQIFDNFQNLFNNNPNSLHHNEMKLNGADFGHKKLESKSHLINNTRVNIENSQANLSLNNKISKTKTQKTNESQKEFDLDEIDLDAYFDSSPPMLIKNNELSTDPLSQFPLNLIIKFSKLNSVQENCFDLLFNTSHNSLITAPTGSGKTLLFEIAIARIIKHYFNSVDNAFNSKKFKIIYLAPIKSLCQEKSFDWKIKFGQSPLDLKVVEATGDSEFINMSQLSSANIILTTPERFDVLTRKWKENPQFVSSICLLLLDEIHLLNEETRGATIEAIVARMKLLSSLSQFSNRELGSHRLVALSATIPNIPEVAEFLQVQNVGLKIFGDEYRPVKIERIVLGYQCGKNSNEYMFEKYLDYRVADIIQKYSEGKPVLVFCQTQKGTINCAKQLINDVTVNKIPIIGISSTQEKLKLETLSSRISNKTLSSMVKYGIGFHNAGLSLNDRQLVEEGFKTSLIRIVCTTSTLAQGVNLPARLVIIKSTNCYRGPKIGYTEYNKMEIDQMVGRAGRPQYDTKGVAIIMTEKEKVDKFNELSSTMIESHLKDNIVEHINAEISTGTIVDINSAVNWIKNTFMYVRMKNNPNKFGIKAYNTKKNEMIENFLKEMCIKIFKDLEENSLILFNSNDNSTTPQSLCRKMSKNYVMFETMRTIAKMTKNQNAIENINKNIDEIILDILSNSKEFSKYSSKMEERKTLNLLNKDEGGIKYKLKGAIDSSNKKAFILLQASLSGVIIDHWELRRQQNEIANASMRILNCLKEYYKHLNCLKGYIACIILKKSLHNGMWSDSDLIMKQLPKIGDKLAKCLFRAGINSFEKLINENPRKIESICGKNSPFGNILIDIAKSIPVIQIGYEIIKTYSTYKLTIKVRVPWEKFIQDDFDAYTCYHVVLVQNDDENGIKFKKKIRPSSADRNFNFSITQITYKSFPLKLVVLCDKFIGLDQIITINSPNDKTGNIVKGTKNIFSFLNKKIYQKHEENQNNDISIVDEEDLIKLIEDENDKKNETEFVSGNGIKKQKGKRKKKEKENESENVTGGILNNIPNTGNNKDLRELIANMKNEYKNNENQQTQSKLNSTNFKLNQIKKYEHGLLDSTNMKTQKTNELNTSTQNLLDKLKDTKSLNLNFDFLDKIEDTRQLNGLNEHNKDKEYEERNKSLFNLSLDDIL